MTYRFLKMTSAYPEFSMRFSAENPDHGSASYEDLLERFICSRYGVSDFYARHMRGLGNEAWEVFASVEILQRAWARDHGFQPQRKEWVHDIAAAQVEYLKPDVIFLQDLFLFDPVFRTLLRSVAPARCRIVGWRSSPTRDFAAFRDLDLVLSAFPHFVERWRSMDIDARLLPLAFEPSVRHEVPSHERDLEFTFVGQIGTSAGPHAQRKRLIEDLVQTTPLEVYGEADMKVGTLRQAAASARRTRSLTPFLSRRERYSIPRKRMHRSVFGLRYYEVLARSRLTLNHHIGSSGRYASNLRLYEATGMGACLVTDTKTDLGRYFEVGTEVVAYENAFDCAEKVSYLVANSSERCAIAAAGQRRTLREHTYENRVRQLDEWLRELLRGRTGG